MRRVSTLGERPAALQDPLERVEVLCHCGAGRQQALCSALNNWQRVVPVVYMILWEVFYSLCLKPEGSQSMSRAKYDSV